MASSGLQQTQTAPREVDDEQWVFVQHDGDAVKEQLLEEQDGDARREKESTLNVVEGRQLNAHDREKLLRWCRSGSYDASGVREILRNAAERLENAQDTQKILWWCRSAWNDAFVRNVFWEDKRLDVFVAALSVYMVLHVLAALVSPTECNALQALLICLKHSTAATMNAAVFSIVTLSLSLTGVKASLVDKSQISGSVFIPYFTSAMILEAACYACIREVGAGITVFQAARREEDFGWFLQLLADMARVHVLTAAIALCAALVVLMWTDVKAPLWAFFLDNMVMADYTKLAAKRSLEGQADEKSSPSLMIVMIAVIVVFGAGIITFILLLISFWHAVHLENAGCAATVTSRKRDTALALI